MHRWGCSHEKETQETYYSKQKPHHTNLTIEDAGLFISMEGPYIGASPDAMVVCDWCGQGAVEIKCPFYFNSFPDTNDSQSNFCMKQDMYIKLNSLYLASTITIYIREKKHLKM